MHFGLRDSVAGFAVVRVLIDRMLIAGMLIARSDYVLLVNRVLSCELK